MSMSLLPSLTSNTQTKIAGETFWSSFPVSMTVTHTQLADALLNSGLDPALARTLASSYAFNRAVTQMSRGKLRDRKEWSQDKISIQISARVHVPDGIDYVREGVVTLDRVTQTISCPDPVIKAEAEKQFNAAMDIRRTNDVTRMLGRIIHPYINKSVFPMKGGVFFALSSEKGLVDKLDNFVKALGGSVTRWEIADGTPQNVTTVQTVVVDSFMDAIMEAQNHIGTVNSESREEKVDNARRNLQDLYDRLRHNARIVGDNMAVLEDHIGYCEALLRKQQAVSPEEQAAQQSTPFNPDDSQDEPEPIPTNGFAYDSGLGVNPEDVTVEIGDSAGNRIVVQSGKIV